MNRGYLITTKHVRTQKNSNVAIVAASVIFIMMREIALHIARCYMTALHLFNAEPVK